MSQQELKSLNANPDSVLRESRLRSGQLRQAKDHAMPGNKEYQKELDDMKAQLARG